MIDALPNRLPATDALSSRRHLRARRSPAFSLVETVMAIGLMSFGLVGVLGLIPAGLKTFRDTINRNGQAAALQVMRLEIGRTSFDDATTTIVKALDEEGRPLANADDPNVFFRVTGTVQTGSAGDATTGLSYLSSSVRIWNVEIARPSTSAETLRFPIWQANMGR